MGPRIPVSVLIAFTIVFHGGVAGAASAAALFSEIFAWNRTVRELVMFKLAQSYEIEVDKEKEKEKEPDPPPPEEKPEEPKPVLLKQATPPPEAPPQPPAAAEAAKVLTADPDPNDPVDMTNTIVQGNADKYAGGVSANNGTSKTAVTNPGAQATGVPGGTGTAAAPPPAPKVDRSRKAGLLGSSDWTDCPFPAEADAEQIDQAFVLIQVRVKPDGSPETVTVVQDPGHGFGREARKCAMRKKFTPALDIDGNAIPAVTNPFRVRFER
jgi:protein TonB